MYDGKSKGGRSDVYRAMDQGSVKAIVYAPPSDTQRPSLELDIPDWWINNAGPQSPAQ